MQRGTLMTSVSMGVIQRLVISMAVVAVGRAQRVPHFPCTFPEQCTQHQPPAPSAAAIVPNVRVVVSRGGAHTCSLDHGGNVRCWGEGSRGQLGDSISQDSIVPVDPLGVQDAISISAGADHSCATGRSGAVKCWGAGQYGQLGYGGVSDKKSGHLVAHLTPAVDASAGGLHTCALERAGSVRCWGLGKHGQLGQGLAESSRYPVLVQSLSEVISICAGAFHSCAAARGGSVSCWGWNAHGQLGAHLSAPDSAAPVPVEGISTAVAVACGYGHSCARLRNDHVHCWGHVVQGQIEQQDQQQILWNWTGRPEMLLEEAVAARDWVQPFGSIFSRFSLTPSPPPWG